MPVFYAWTEGGSPESRIQAVHCLVHKLPEKNRQVLGLLMKHLAKWVVIVHSFSTSHLLGSLFLLFMSVSSFSLHMLFLSISLTPTLFTPPSLLSLHLFSVYSVTAGWKILCHLCLNIFKLFLHLFFCVHFQTCLVRIMRSYVSGIISAFYCPPVKWNRTDFPLTVVYIPPMDEQLSRIALFVRSDRKKYLRNNVS